MVGKVPDRRISGLRSPQSTTVSPPAPSGIRFHSGRSRAHSKCGFENGGQSPSPTESSPRVAGERLTVAPSVAPQVAEQTYVVKPRDTLWSIAEAELGSPLGWRQLAAANYGRPQPDGEELTNDHWIRPGWVLVIPSPGRCPGGSGAGGTPSLIVSTGAAVPPAIEGMTGSPYSANSLATRKRCSVESTAASECGSVGAVGSHSAATPHPESAADHPAPISRSSPSDMAFSGLGSWRCWTACAEPNRRLRPEGLRIALPEGDLIELERGLRFGADPGAADWVDLSLRLLSANVRRDDLETPTISAVLLRDDVVEVILQTDSCLPPPFEAGSADNRWILRKSGQLLDELRKDSEVIGIDAPRAFTCHAGTRFPGNPDDQHRDRRLRRRFGTRC